MLRGAPLCFNIVVGLETVADGNSAVEQTIHKETYRSDVAVGIQTVTGVLAYHHAQRRTEVKRKRQRV